jgi:hypothetical protein
MYHILSRIGNELNYRKMYMSRKPDAQIPYIKVCRFSRNISGPRF